jgi:hypothetical protein
MPKAAAYMNCSFIVINAGITMSQIADLPFKTADWLLEGLREDLPEAQRRAARTYRSWLAMKAVLEPGVPPSPKVVEDHIRKTRQVLMDPVLCLSALYDWRIAQSGFKYQRYLAGLRQKDRPADQA